MALIPIFKPYTPEQLTEQFNLTFNSPEWVNVEFLIRDIKTINPWLDSELNDTDTVEYECNRYDAIYIDKLASKTISVYIYMNERCDQIIAIDDIVQDVDAPIAQYRINDTPIGDIIRKIRNEFNITINPTQPKFPTLDQTQLAIFNEQIQLNIEVDSRERPIVKQNGDIEYKPLPEGETTGFFDGNVFGNYFQTDRIDHIEVIYRAAEIFTNQHFDIKKTHHQIAKEFEDYII